MSDRFESYETTLRNCLTESKEALTSKGVEVPEETKLRNVPGLIDGIEVGHSGNAITINCKDEAFLGQTLTARHTDGTTVTKTIDSLTCVIEIPKDGEWTVKNSKTSEQFKFVFDTVRDLVLFSQATIRVTVIADGNIAMEHGPYLEIDNPSGSRVFSKMLSNLNKFYGSAGNKASEDYIAKQTGNYKVLIGIETEPVSTKYVNVEENNKIYEITFHGNYDTFYDTGSELPSIDGEETVQTEIQPKWFAVNTTDMTEQQQEEIFNEIDKMIEQNKSDEEINAYISSKEAEYGQI